MPQDKRVLLTGASGFIGRNAIVPLIERGYEVHAASRGPLREPLFAAVPHAIDLLDGAAVRSLVRDVAPTHLLHFAWFAVPGQYGTSSKNVSWVRASLELLEAFAESGGRRVVMAGTCAEYDWDAGHCVEDRTPLIPKTLYGVSKHALGTMVRASAPALGVSAAWGRIFFLYGPREHPLRLVPSVVVSLLREEPALCTRGEQIRDFLHVADVADAFAALLDSEVTGAVNIASGLPVPVKHVIGAIAERLRRPNLVHLGALELTEPLALTADVRRLQAEVGWKPRFDIGTGLEDTISWWRDQPH